MTVQRLRQLWQATTTGPWEVSGHGQAGSEAAWWIVEAHRLWPHLLTVAEAAENELRSFGADPNMSLRDALAALSEATKEAE